MPIIPLIFHSIDFSSAPKNNNMHIDASKQSWQCYVTGLGAAGNGLGGAADTEDLGAAGGGKFGAGNVWSRQVYTEEDFSKIIAQPEWMLPFGEKLLEYNAWAIISDVIRMYALYTYGGLYCDWDVEFVRPLPAEFFEHGVVLGFEPYTYSGRGTAQVGAQLCMAAPRNQFFKLLFQHFRESLWTADFDILPGLITKTLETEYSLPKPRNAHNYYYLHSTLNDNIVVMPNDIFYPFMGTRILAKDTTLPQGNSSTIEIGPHTIALHWEHSQMKDTINITSTEDSSTKKFNAGKQGWTNYLDKLRRTPVAEDVS